MTTRLFNNAPEAAISSVQHSHKIIGIPKEIAEQERRVAATPETVQLLQKLGFDILVETGAGATAFFSDEVYRQAGCRVLSDAETLWRFADIVLKVRPPQFNEALGKHEADLLREGGTLVSFIYPAQNSGLIQQLADRKATVLAMDTVPRISRAQKMDALSSMANLAGYRAVLEAANHWGHCFSGQITAAGKMPPTKVLVIGAGVAGLAAIRTAKSLGAIVRAFDTRPVVKEQVESLGGEFLELHFAEDGTGEGGYAKVMSEAFIRAEMALFAEQAREVDIIITTALIPGKRSPILITRDMVESMKEGSIIVDMAAEQGGNCEVTRPGEVYRYDGVVTIGLTDFPSKMSAQASQLYGMNLCHLLEELGGAEHYHLDFDDDVTRNVVVLHEGTLTYPPAQKEELAPPQQGNVSPQPPTPKAPSAQSPTPTRNLTLFWLVLTGLVLIGVGLVAPASFLSHFTVFVLACLVGWQVIWNVKPALHTPLMSVTNAISGIIILGGMLQLTDRSEHGPMVLGAIAILIGTMNISGGFLVTQRMLKMFQR
jgi:NAD(P) transhydrogenase subunit alpha